MKVAAVYPQKDLNLYDFINLDEASLATYPAFLKNKNSCDLYKSQENIEIDNLYNELSKKQGFIEKIWDKIKNKLNLKYSSEYMEKNLRLYKEGSISDEEMNQNINGYINSQKRALDFCADVVSVTAGWAAFALAMSFPAAGLSVGFLAAMTGGAISKVLIKFIDAKEGNRKYKTIPFDILTGAINGFLCPLVNGFGNAITKKTSKAFNVSALSNVEYKEINPKSMEEFLDYFSRYPKQKLKGKFFNKLLPYSMGKSFKGVSKFVLTAIMREVGIKIFDKNNITVKFTPAMNIVNSLDSTINLNRNTKEIDFSNDIYDVKNQNDTEQAKT